MTDSPLGSLPDGIYGVELQRRIDEAAATIREALAGEPALLEPQVVFVLGSGLGGLAELLDPAPRVRVPYRDIPHVPTGSVAGHAGELLAGLAHGSPVVVLSGRAHPYEGYSHREATLLLRAVLSLGPRTVVLTNAAGGINPAFAAGEVMLIRDTINLSGENPLLGPNLDAFGPRFPGMADAFDLSLREHALAAAQRAGETLHQGVYLMLSGPAYETRAELRMLRILGADAVGMSTVHEAIVARHADRRVVGFSLITNAATEEMEVGPTHEEVMEMGKLAGERLLAILRGLLPDLA